MDEMQVLTAAEVNLWVIECLEVSGGDKDEQSIYYDEIAAYIWVKMIMKLSAGRTKEKIAFNTSARAVCEFSDVKNIFSDFKFSRIDREKRPTIDELILYVHKSLAALLRLRKVTLV